MDVQAHHLGLKLSPLDFAPLLYGLITGLILYLPLVALYNLTLHPLARARIPLYSVGSVASSWPATLSMLLKGKRHVEVHERQPLVGPVMRTGANEVVLSDPAWNRFIMGSKFSKVSTGCAGQGHGQRADRDRWPIITRSAGECRSYSSTQTRGTSTS